MAGSLKFNLNSAASSVATGVSATVASGATLELAGTFSALGAGSGRASVANSSTAPSGLLVTGAHQVTGPITGTGNTQVNAGGDLSAASIQQTTLIIGGVSGNPALTTILASDASGNPLSVGAGSVGGDSLMPDVSSTTDAIQSASSSFADAGTAGAALGGSLGGTSTVATSAAVPEPSALCLGLLAVFAISAARRRQGRKRSAAL
jgi:hypothetical protein